jgi:hypothetical protein
LRANTVGTNDLKRFVRKRTPTAGERGATERSQQIRPQADSYSGRTRRAQKRSEKIRPQADSYSERTRRAANYPIARCRSSLASERGGHKNDVNRFVRKRTPTAGEGGATERSQQIRPQADSYSGRTRRAQKRSQQIRPQADSYSGRTRRAPNNLNRFVRKRTPTAGERGGQRTIAKDSSASGLLQRANAAGSE